ncbi:MAG: heptaprenyl diphosphate synthase [Syntrophomonadaceae bacterium]|nr:heptaprenyl diphosphate synthase [Syntrophomonadaceae bacterium]
MSDFNLFSAIEVELGEVERQLTKNIITNIDILYNSSVHLINAGGKRLRPAFALLAARLFNKDINNAIPMAVALELVHMATLVHDDVIDNSVTRRGTITVKKGWGNRVSIYAGNYILARSLSIVAGYNRRDLLDIMADTSMKIVEGEIIQMQSSFNVNTGLKNYLRRIERKTALLISVSCQLGALVSDAPEKYVYDLQRYGYYLGMAFQVTDDILDLIADEEILGKPIGSDIRQGVITLPALYAMHNSKHAKELKVALASSEICNNNTQEIIEMIKDSEGIDYSYYVSQKFARKAQEQLNKLPDVPE